MLNEVQPDLRELLDLVRKGENFDATLAALHMAGKAIEPELLTLVTSPWPLGRR